MTDDMNEDKAIHDVLKKLVEDMQSGKVKLDVVKMDLSEETLEQMKEAKEELEALQMKMPKNEMQAMEWADTFIEDTYKKLASSGLDKLRCLGILDTIKFMMLCPSAGIDMKKKDDGSGKDSKKKLVSKPA
jgi:hypothetical protein